MAADRSQGIEAHLKDFWSSNGQDLSDIDEVMRHPEAVYLHEIESEFLESPDAYQRWISGVGDERLQLAENLTQRDVCLSDVRRQFESGAIGPHIAAEAMQIIVNDLTLIEEMTYAGPILDGLRQRLTDEACDLVVRLVKNTVRDCLAQLHAGEVDGNLVQPLSQKLADQTSHSMEGKWRPHDGPVLLVMTAGRGTRLRTTIPKALLPLNGRSLLHSILEAARSAGIEQALFNARGPGGFENRMQ